jgi:voltage-gated potassium channel
VISLRPILRAVLVLVGVIVSGTVGYLFLGFSLMGALYQTVTTVSTVGFREVEEFGTAEQVFTMVLIACGVGAVLYNLGVVFEAVTEGHLKDHLRRRRMDREIDRMSGHVVVCGFGRVGRAAYEHLRQTDGDVVVVDRDAEQFAQLPEGAPHVIGDVTDDAVLRAAGVDRARSVIVALDSDADTVYATLSARALAPDLVVVSRVSSADARRKVELAGATRVVNPQGIGGRRMAVYALQPEVSEFLDVVVHDEGLDFQLREVHIGDASGLRDRTVGEVDLPGTTGALLLALRHAPGEPFRPSPRADERLPAGAVLIVLGTAAELQAVADLAARGPGDGRLGGDVRHRPDRDESGGASDSLIP